MNEPEIEWKIEEKSTTESTDTSGSETPPESGPAWEITAPDSENNIDSFPDPVEDGPKVVGEIRLTLFEDETMKVEFPNLGRWTPGRLEKAMPRLFRECMLERHKALRTSQGLSERFVMGNEGEE